MRIPVRGWSSAAGVAPGSTAGARSIHSAPAARRGAIKSGRLPPILPALPSEARVAGEQGRLARQRGEAGALERGIERRQIALHEVLEISLDARHLRFERLESLELGLG